MRTEGIGRGIFSWVGKDLSQVENNPLLFCRISINNMLTVLAQRFVLDDFVFRAGEMRGFHATPAKSCFSQNPRRARSAE